MNQAVVRSLAVFPAGSNGEFDLPAESAIVIDRGRGCELWDVDGRRYVDFSMGWGSVLVGHAHPQVAAAVVGRASLGSNFSFVTTESLALAEEIIALSPACERVRFCASGTEATMYCLRLARAFTGRNLVLKFEGAYHGAHDVGVTSLFPTEPPCYPLPQPSSAGVEPGVRDSVLVVPYNDLDAARRVIHDRRVDLACVIVEPLHRCTSPAPGFLEGLREATVHAGVLLVFDEVVTGFRLALGGAQEYYGVIPDLVAYGKALGGGYPIGAVGGRREIMELVREDRLGKSDYVWTASTLGGNPVSCRAARAALEVLSGDGVYPRLRDLGEYFREGLRRAAADARAPAQIIGDGPLAQFVFSSQPIRNYRDSQAGDRARARAVMLELFRSGVFLNPMGTKLYLSLAHDEAACDEFLAHFATALQTAG